LLTLVSGFGLLGAAAAVSGCAIVDLVVFLWITVPRIKVTLWQLVACLVRPMIAAAAMVILLSWLDMAWTPSSTLDTAGLVWDLGIRSGVGAVCYTSVLAGVWIIAGRPDGPERHVLSALGSAWAKIRAPGVGQREGLR